MDYEVAGRLWNQPSKAVHIKAAMQPIKLALLLPKVPLVYVRAAPPASPIENLGQSPISEENL